MQIVHSIEALDAALGWRRRQRLVAARLALRSAGFTPDYIAMRDTMSASI